MVQISTILTELEQAMASRIGVAGRVELSNRLADLPEAPRGVIRQFALDDITVARPVLTRSPRLEPNDLVAVAASKGRDHMLAMTERATLPPLVTDYLVLKGDKLISQALAGHPGAAFSPRGMGLLVTRALTDETLQLALAGRRDLAEDMMRQLGAATKASALRKLGGAAPKGLLRGLPGWLRREPDALPAPDETRAASTPEESEPAGLDAARGQVMAALRAGTLDEAALRRAALAGERAYAICAVAALVKVQPAAAERLLFGPDRDTALVLGRALGWSWPTVRAVLGLRPAADQLPHLIDKARKHFDDLTPGTAERVLRFIQVREQTAQREPGTPAA
jgi:hypothetical protein